MNYFNEILNKAKKLEGQSIRLALPGINSNYSNNRRITKSVLANYIERDYFGLELSSHSDADFREIGTELKTTGIHFVKARGLYNAKERLVLTQIDYKDVIENKAWTDNSHLKKINKILFIIYLYEPKPVRFEDFKIIHTFIWEPSKKHSELLQRDYASIREKIIKGEILSEKHTDFLASCPRHGGGYNKSAPSLSKSGAIAKHPNLDFAERRAFCIKQRAFDRIIADSLNIKLRRYKGSIGLYKNDYPNFEKKFFYES